MEGQLAEAPEVILRLNSSLRNSQRGASRVRSAIITQKEISLLRRDAEAVTSSPRAVQGFVRSMAKFYTDIFTSDNNNNKCNGVGGIRPRSNSSSRLKEEEEDKDHAEDSKPKPLTIRRSQSFSRVQQPDSCSPQLSPTWQSLRSQDSGFSDSGEDSVGCHHSAEGEPIAAVGCQPCSCDSPPGQIACSRHIAAAAASPQRQPQHGCDLIRPKVDNHCATTSRPVTTQNKVTINRVSEVVHVNKDDDCVSACDVPSVVARNRRKDSNGEECFGRRILPPEPPPGAALFLDRRHSGLIFSTPLRASFNQRRRTIAGLEEAEDTPVLLLPASACRTTRLKDVKRRRRRLSSQQLSASLSPMTNAGKDRDRLLSVSRTPQQERAWGDNEVTKGQLFNFSYCTTASAVAAVSQSMIEDEEWGQPREFLAGVLEGPWLPGLRQKRQTQGGKEDVRARAQLGPVYDWWRELLHQAEPECLTYLQSKPVGGRGAPPPLEPPPATRIRILSDAAQNVHHIFTVFKR